MRTQTLSELMDFDHVIQVHPDGSVTEPRGIYAPNLYDDALEDDAWDFFTRGYSGQDSYSGPIMHNSELIGGRLERDILETPGIYAAVVAYWSPDDDDADAELYAEGWAIVRLREVTL